MLRYLLETIVVSADDARAAAAGGADRFEVCSALALGGLTPSIGAIRAIRASTDVPIMAMVRPREGGMAYTEGEFSAMLADAEALLEAGANPAIRFVGHAPVGELEYLAVASQDVRRIRETLDRIRETK